MAMCLAAAMFPSAANAEMVDFVNGIWNFGSGNVTGWQQPPLTDDDYSGTTTLSNGITVTVRFRDIGSVNHTASSASADHLSPTVDGGGLGLNLNQSSGSAFNFINGSLNSYLRMDVTFSAPVETSLFLHDIDRSQNNWVDTVFAESFTGSFGAVGTGDIADYTLGSNLDIVELHTQDLDSIIPETGTGDVSTGIIDFPTELTPHSAEIGFDDTIERFSLYYWNRDFQASNSDNQRLILTAFEVINPNPVAIPEPGSVALLSLAGAIGFFWNRKRRGTEISA